jgi:hypothetical protein
LRSIHGFFLCQRRVRHEPCHPLEEVGGRIDLGRVDLILGEIVLPSRGPARGAQPRPQLLRNLAKLLDLLRRQGLLLRLAGPDHRREFRQGAGESEVGIPAKEIDAGGKCGRDLPDNGIFQISLQRVHSGPQTLDDG